MSSLPFGSQSSSDSMPPYAVTPTAWSSLPFGSQSSSDAARTRQWRQLTMSLHCLSALSPLRTRLRTACAAGRGIVFIAFRLSVLFGQRPNETRQVEATSSLPFGSQSSSDGFRPAKDCLGAPLSSLPFGSQSSSDCGARGCPDQAHAASSLPFGPQSSSDLEARLIVPNGQSVSSLPLGSQSSSD